MSFVLLLLIGLSTLVQVELNRADGELQQFAARQNALFGMRVGLAQLQHAAGPDQRITARAEIFENEEQLLHGARHWTGVWDAAPVEAVRYPAWGDVDSEPPVQSAQPRLLVELASWLVSGVEQGAMPGVPDGSRHVRAVGAAPTGDSTSQPDVVEVPIVAIPGAGSSGTAGGFGYWIADESLKAKVNVTIANPEEAVVAGDEKLQFKVMHRAALENVTGSGIPDEREQILALQPGLGKVTVLGMLDYFIPEASAGETVRLGRRLHDLTTSSLGVIANSRDGGLRRDLTRAFEEDVFSGGDRVFPLGPLWLLFKDYYDLADEFDGPSAAIAPRHNDWVNLRQYWLPGRFIETPAEREALTNAGESIPIDPRVPHWFSRVQVAPVIVQLGLSFALSLEPFIAPDPWDGDPGFDDYLPGEYFRIVPYLQPWLVMANPYNVALEETEYLIQTGLLEGATPPYVDNSSRTRRTESALDIRFGLNRPSNVEGEGDISRFFRISELIAEEPNDKRAVSAEYIFTAAFEPGEVKLFSAGPQTGSPADGRITTQRFELREGEPDPDFWLRGYLPLQYTAVWDRWQSERIAMPEPPTTDTAEESFALVRSDRAGGLFDIFSLPSGQHANLRYYLRPAEDLDWTDFRDVGSEGPMGGAGMYYFMKGSSTSGSANQLSINSPVPMFHWGLSFKSSESLKNAATGDPVGFRGLVNANFRSPGGNRLFINGTTPLGWSDSLPYVQEYGGGNQPLLDFSMLWEPVDQTDGRIVLFHLPREPLLSVGDFQHLDASRSVYAPAYAVGNSYASPWIGSDRTWFSDWHRPTAKVFDLSWHLNHALWDGHFFSSWQRDTDADGEPVAAAMAPVNERLRPIMAASAAAALDHDQIAGALLIDGPFNINSTSIEAWKAILGGMNRQQLEYRDARSGQTRTTEVRNPIMRSAYPSGGSSSSDPWVGFRELSLAEIDRLAHEIVEQVKERGPFRSLADFINRTPGSEDNPHSRMGPLQAAIDAAGLNAESWNVHFVNQVDSRVNSLHDSALLGSRRSGIHGYITQADILRVLGPVLTSRSDTFVIRAYGESFGPMNQSPEPLAFAWCEAVVQRLPDWIDAAEGLAPHESPSLLGETFGRRFHIVSFRWLDSQEL